MKNNPTLSAVIDNAWLSLLIILLCPILFCGCCKMKNEACVDPVLEPIYVGYSGINMDTLVVRMYQANDEYKTLLDTFQLSRCNGIDSNSCYISDTVAIDTVNFFIQQGYGSVSQNPNFYCEIRKGYDWSIYIPSIGHADSISNITIQQTSGSVEECCCKAPGECSNKLSSLKINETTLDSITPYYYYGPGYSSIYIHR